MTKPPFTGLPEKLEAPAAVREALAVLAWYADPATYTESGTPHPIRPFEGIVPIREDEGARARAALARLDETRKGKA